MKGSALIQLAILIGSLLIVGTDGGLIKNLFQKVTGTGNRTDDAVKQSSPICGSNIFATANENSVSPEIIFITNRPSRTVQADSGNYGNQRNRDEANRRKDQDVSEVAKEFRFNAENVTLEELERNGFNPDAPVTFLMHGFTSGYPLQAWMSAIVEAYTIDRETSSNYNHNHNGFSQGNQGPGGQQNSQYDGEYDRRREDTQARRGNNQQANGSRVNHNLFIINWNYAARGIHYARAVANIPVVATYVTRFINERILGDARIDATRIQLIGHSLGAHLAGFIGKNVRPKVGRIYGLDPAGPCFGAISGPLYPASNRLASSDALEVITLHTNTALLGINKPLGRYSVFVEGGSVQPGCKGGGILESLNTLTWDGASFDALACSHSRAPNLLTYRYDQSDTEDDCQLVAYECKDWESYLAGHCGYCPGSSNDQRDYSSAGRSQNGPLQPVECLRIGLDWQYPEKGKGGSTSGSWNGGHQSSFGNSSNSHHGHSSTRRPLTQTSPGYGFTRDDDNVGENEGHSGGRTSTRRPASSGYDLTHDNDDHGREPEGGFGSESGSGSGRTSTRRPTVGHTNSSYDNLSDGYSPNTRRTSTRLPWEDSGYQSPASYNDYSRDNQMGRERDSVGGARSSTRRPPGSFAVGEPSQRNRRESGQETDDRDTSERRREDADSGPKVRSMFLRTGDTQPYCTYQYQVVLELNEPFPRKKKPPISLVLQDSDSLQEHHLGQHGSQRAKEQNSLTNDDFGNKFDDRTYAHLMTSAKKLKRVDHATLLFRESLPDGFRILKGLHVNYMSHMDPTVRRRFSARLCPVKTENDSSKDFSTDKRFYFKPCGDQQASGHTQDNHRPTTRRPTPWA